MSGNSGVWREGSVSRPRSPGLINEQNLDRKRLKKKQYAPTLVSLDGWERVPAEQRWDFFDPDPRVHKDTTLSLSRHMSKADIFSALLPPSLVEKLSPTTDASEAYAMWGFTAFIIASEPPSSHPSKHHDKERLRLAQLRSEVARASGGRVVAPGVRKFKRLQQDLLLTTTFAREDLSSHLASVVASWGETVALDEKMRTWRGDSPHFKTVLSKPEARGHWTTQVIVKLEEVEQPFCIGLYPFDSVVNLNETITMEQIWTWVRGMLPEHGAPCIVADSYYMTRPILRELAESNVRFVCAVKSSNFKEHVSVLNKGVDEVGKTSVLYQPSTNTLAVHHFDADVGKKYVMTNALKLSASRERERGFHTAYWIYRHRFSYCDEFNRKLHGFKYPFRRSTWQMNFDSLFVSTLLVNCYHAWLYVNSSNSCASLIEFTRLLGLELMASQ